jgi:hypothetical protein
MIPRWRQIWRIGLAPMVSRRGLAALENALMNDDPRLLQGVTCAPPLVDVLSQRTACAACALGFTGWQGEGLRSIGQVADYFHQLCDAADDALGEPGACRFFLNWYDDTPRSEMRQELLAEVRRELARRQAVAA